MNYYVVSEWPKEGRPQILKLEGRPMPSGLIKIKGQPMALGCRATADSDQVFDSPEKALASYEAKLRAEIDVATARLALAKSKLERVLGCELKIVDRET